MLLFVCMMIHDEKARVFDQGPTVYCTVLTPHQERIPATRIFTTEILAQAILPYIYKKKKS